METKVKRFVFCFASSRERERERERMSKIISRSRNAGVFDLAKHFLSAVWAKTYGKVLLTSWVVNLIYLFLDADAQKEKKGY